MYVCGDFEFILYRDNYYRIYRYYRDNLNLMVMNFKLRIFCLL